MSLSLVPQSQVSQSVTINSSIIQSIKLLQFAREELEAFLLEQCQRNPLIELTSRRDPNAGAADAVVSKSDQQNAAARTGIAGMDRHSAASSGSYSGDDLRRLEEHVPEGVSLSNHLHRQLGSAFRDPVDLAIATQIIASLDDDGYLRAELESMADEIGAPPERIERVLAKIQKMDPAGVGARDLAECLRLQLQERGLLTSAFSLLLENLPILAAHKYRELTALCDVSHASLMAMVQQIRELDPRPGRQFDHAPVIPVAPDVTVELLEDGGLFTVLNENVLPRVLVNRQYYSEIRTGCRSRDEKKFVMDCLNDANMLVRSLDQRAQTILKVATEVVTRQHDFLLRGVEHLKPLILKEVADAIGIHQSTVSRAIANKYIMTPVGLFELKYFFVNSISSVGDEDAHASEAVRHRIRQLIAEEECASILSDDAIVSILRGERVKIARRTVAKYRESMDIPSSHQRRRMRQAAIA